MQLRLFRKDFGIAAVLLVLILVVFSSVRQFDFFDFDDGPYVPFNKHVMSGLSWENLRWAFTSTDDVNWMPLTWISFMADRQFFGPPEDVPSGQVIAGPYHWTNVWLHAANAVLLFGLLRWITGLSWPSAAVAFFFGIHPQHVESVAWVAERKDVLSGLFWMLAMWSYAGYAKRPNAGGYLRTLALYLLGFMAKPMIVTLPVVLLLFDIWPLGRFSVTEGWRRGARLLVEKLPFLAVAAVMSAVTILVQHAGGAVRTLDEVPWSARWQYAVLSTVVYLYKTVWPVRLAVFYSIQLPQPTWQVIGACLAIAGITALVLRCVRTRPYLAVGWFWYLVTLLPVIGLIQVGSQVRADRYTYLPSIGLSLMLVWSGVEVWGRWPHLRTAMVVVCGTACVACTALTAKQVSYWQNSQTLFEHAIAVTDHSALAHASLGKVWERQGMFDQAIAEYQAALTIAPHSPGLLANLGDLLYRQGRTGDAAASFEQAVQIDPNNAIFHNRLGTMLAAGNPTEAMAQFEAAVRLKPDYREAEINLGNLLTKLGRASEGEQHYSRGFQLQRDLAPAK
jgi:Tfp pilus assembly protein PilF